jgi:hypothetical protein
MDRLRLSRVSALSFALLQFLICSPIPSWYSLRDICGIMTRDDRYPADRLIHQVNNQHRIREGYEYYDPEKQTEN